MKLDPNPLIRLNFHDLLNGAPLYFLSRKKKNSRRHFFRVKIPELYSVTFKTRKIEIKEAVETWQRGVV